MTRSEIINKVQVVARFSLFVVRSTNYEFADREFALIIGEW
ncbi:hypothetical protein [Desulfosporosinus nitroreducens]|nr:hypothetical protein [Desulfosporosinus nitroreducens]